MTTSKDDGTLSRTYMEGYSFDKEHTGEPHTVNSLGCRHFFPNHSLSFIQTGSICETGRQLPCIPETQLKDPLGEEPPCQNASSLISGFALIGMEINTFIHRCVYYVFTVQLKTKF